MADVDIIFTPPACMADTTDELLHHTNRDWSLSPPLVVSKIPITTVAKENFIKFPTSVISLAL